MYDEEKKLLSALADK